MEPQSSVGLVSYEVACQINKVWETLGANFVSEGVAGQPAAITRIIKSN